MKTAIRTSLLILSLSCSGMPIESANQRIPEIMRDPSLIIDTVFYLDAKDKTPFLVNVEKAVNAFPASPVEVKKLSEDVKFYSFCSTNKFPKLPENFVLDRTFGWRMLKRKPAPEPSSPIVEPGCYCGQGTSVKPKVKGRIIHTHAIWNEYLIRKHYFLIRYYKEAENDKEDDIERFFGEYKEDNKEVEWRKTPEESIKFVTYRDSLNYFNKLDKTDRPYCHIVLYRCDCQDVFDGETWLPIYQFKNDGLL